MINMGNAIFVGDVHLKGSNPQSRQDDYPQQILQKIQWLHTVAAQHGVSHIYFLGDIFDSVNTSLQYFAQCHAVFAELAEKYTVYTVVGNHDLRYNNFDTLASCPLGLLVATTGVQLLDAPVQQRSVLVQGAHWGTEQPPPRPAAAAGLHSVCLLHMFYQSGYGERALTIDDCLDAQHDVYILGHDHCPYEPHKTDYYTVHRPGSLARNSGEQYNRLRVPRVLILDTETVQYQYVDYPHTANTAEVFTQPKELPVLQLLPVLQQSWSSNTKTPQQLVADFPAAVRDQLLSYLQQLGI